MAGSSDGGEMLNARNRPGAHTTHRRDWFADPDPRQENRRVADESIVVGEDHGESASVSGLRAEKPSPRDRSTIGAVAIPAGSAPLRVADADNSCCSVIGDRRARPRANDHPPSSSPLVERRVGYQPSAPPPSLPSSPPLPARHCSREPPARPTGDVAEAAQRCCARRRCTVPTSRSRPGRAQAGDRPDLHPSRFKTL